MEQLSLWVGAGLVTAGVSAALLAGAAVADASTSGSEPAGTVSAGSAASVSAGSAPAASVSAGSASARSAKPLAGKARPARRVTTAERRTSHRIPTVVHRGAPAANRPEHAAGHRDSHLPRAFDRLRLSQHADVDSQGPHVSPSAKPQRVSTGIDRAVSRVVSAVFDGFAELERVATGPPVLPPNSTVTVGTSTLELSNGQSVPANWYFPDDEQPPDRMILLQHGFLASGPMYSYTAARIAERTDSVVVTPTLSSNPYAGDSQWLGGDGMSKSVADLFVGDRASLTDSAVAAGYARRYGLSPEQAVLPEKFALAGHSLGASLVSGAAGYLVDDGAADDLVGVILFDGVPLGDTLLTALTKLDDYARQDNGHYIPVREIGAPWNIWNSVSTVNDDLSDARPGQYNGVVLDGGVHMDSMQGGNPLIQFIAYAAAGFPQPQNPPAVEELAVSWLNEWFEEGGGGGDEVAPGSRVDIVTARGIAHGVAIDRSPAALSWLVHELQDAVGAIMASPVFDPPSAARVVAPRRPDEAGPLLALAV